MPHRIVLPPPTKIHLQDINISRIARIAPASLTSHSPPPTTYIIIATKEGNGIVHNTMAVRLAFEDCIGAVGAVAGVVLADFIDVEVGEYQAREEGSEESGGQERKLHVSSLW